jgi:hypothetical protein
MPTADITIDTLDAVLEIAAEVMQECAPDPGNTRLERLSRYIVTQLGGAPYTTDEATEVIGRLDDMCVLADRGSIIDFDIPSDLEVAVASLRLSEAAD